MIKQLFRKKSPGGVVVETQKPMPSLLACLLFDLIGYASFGLPFLDMVWAPVSALIFWKMFGFRKGFLGGAFSFIEELMPGLDFIPTFTINWLLLYFRRNKGSLFIRPVAR